MTDKIKQRGVRIGAFRCGNGVIDTGDAKGIRKQFARVWKRGNRNVGDIQAYTLLFSFSENELNPENMGSLDVAADMVANVIEKNYPGHQYTIVAQNDGKSGLVHCHACINALNYKTLKACRGRQTSYSVIREEIEKEMELWHIPIDYGKQHIKSEKKQKQRTAKIKNNQELNVRLTRDLQKKGYDTKRLQDGKRLVLITGHRRENFGEGFLNICNAIKDLAAQHPDVDFVYPMHLNPNVRKPIHDVFGEDLSNLGNIFFIEPLEYLMFVFLMEKANIVLTDSGGIQEEAPGLGKPVLVMRDTTERPEAVEAGTIKLVGTNYQAIIDSVSCLLSDSSEYEKMSKAANPYGDGQACKRIIEKISSISND